MLDNTVLGTLKDGLDTVTCIKCLGGTLSQVQLYDLNPSLSSDRPVDALTEGITPDSLWRRYSEFELLRNYLLVTYPFVVVAPLPEKRVRENKEDALD